MASTDSNPGINDGEDINRIVDNLRGGLSDNSSGTGKKKDNSYPAHFQNDEQTPIEREPGSKSQPKSDTAQDIGQDKTYAYDEKGERIEVTLEPLEDSDTYGGGTADAKTSTNTSASSNTHTQPGGLGFVIVDSAPENKNQDDTKSEATQDKAPEDAIKAGNEREQEILKRIGKMRPFRDIQAERATFRNSPNPTREAELKKEVDNLYALAREIGLFEDLHDKFEKIQHNLGIPFDRARAAIASIDTVGMESRLRGNPDNPTLFGWHDNLLGMLTEYKEVALMYMDLELDRAEAKLEGSERRAQIADLEKKIRTRAWGNKPVGLDYLAERFVQARIDKEEEKRRREEEEREKRREEKKEEKKEKESPKLIEMLRAYRRAAYYLTSFTKEEYLDIAKTLIGKERELSDIEYKVFAAARFKRTKPIFSLMKDNEDLNSLTTREVVTLMKEMPGYLESMQLIAKLIVGRRDIAGLNFGYLDISNDSQLEIAVDAMVANLQGRGGSGITRSMDRDALQRSLILAMNSMYIFNVSENYMSVWNGKRRLKYLEAEKSSVYGRLCSKPMYDALHPMDNFLGFIFKSREEFPNIPNVEEWARTQVEKNRIPLDQVSEVRVLGYSPGDVRTYWRIQNEGSESNPYNVLYVPPLRPSHLPEFGSVLDTTSVNTTSGKTTFLEALASGQNINYDNLGAPDNMFSVYNLSVEDADTLKDVFKGKMPKDDNIREALGSFGLGQTRELLAWIYLDVVAGLNTWRRAPVLRRVVKKNTNADRTILGLPRKRFNFLWYQRARLFFRRDRINWNS